MTEKSVIDLAELLAATSATTKHAYNLPAPEDIGYHKSISRPFATALDASADRILSLTNALLDVLKESQSSADPSTKRKSKKRKLRDQDDVINSGEFQSRVVDYVDTLLENADKYLDEWNGQSLAVQEPVAGPSTLTHPPANVALRLPPGLLDAKIKKPQLLFSRNLPRDRSAVFVPNITSKPNASTPLDLTMHKVSGLSGSKGFQSVTPHPYAEEIRSIPSNLPIHWFQRPPEPEPLATNTFEATPFTFVDTLEEFENMLQILEQSQEIAVDLEHHDHHSYHGIVCLIQISVSGHDYVIDVLVPEIRDQMERLNKSFTDPNKVKVFHGADMDIKWLQRDFGVYVVGLFDTFQASKALEYAQHSLAALLVKYVGFEADKRYQLADWRIRPLPAEMLFYARSDTHYLLHVYHCLRNHVFLAKGEDGLRRIFELSALTTAQNFVFPEYDRLSGLGPIGWRSIVQKWGKGVEYNVPRPPLPYKLTARTKTSLEFHIFRAIHDWRDLVAREEDESPRYVLANANVFKLAEKRPVSGAAVMACVTPVSAIVATKREALADLIRTATEEWEDLADATLPNQSVSLEQNQSGAHVTGQVSSLLWSKGSQGQELSSKHSAFFRSKDETGTDHSGYGTSASALFGSTHSAVPKQSSLNQKFVRVLDAIRSSISLAASFSAAPDIFSEGMSVGEENNNAAPAGSRSARQPPPPDQTIDVNGTVQHPAKDDIVILSETSEKKAKKKKRKQLSTEGDIDAALSEESLKSKKQKKRPKEAADNMQANDVPILDMPPTTEVDAVSVEVPKKEKKRKSKGLEPSEFKQAKAPRQSSKANMTMTFS